MGACAAALQADSHALMNILGPNAVNEHQTLEDLCNSLELRSLEAAQDI